MDIGVGGGEGGGEAVQRGQDPPARRGGNDGRPAGVGGDGWPVGFPAAGGIGRGCCPRRASGAGLRQKPIGRPRVRELH